MSAGATFFASTGAAVARVDGLWRLLRGTPASTGLEEVPSLDTETETSTLAVDTEMSTVPVSTISVTPGTLTLTSTATVGTVGVTGSGGASCARAVATCAANTKTHTADSVLRRGFGADFGALLTDGVQVQPLHSPPQQRLPDMAKTSPPLLVSNVAETRREVNAIRKNLPAEPKDPTALSAKSVGAEQRTGLPALPCGGLGR